MSIRAIGFMSFILVLSGCAQVAAAAEPAAVATPSRIDPELATFIAGIRAVDNHSHVNSTDPQDADSDALPLDALPDFDLPARFSPRSPDRLAAYRAVYGYAHDDLSAAHLAELRAPRSEAHPAKP